MVQLPSANQLKRLGAALRNETLSDNSEFWPMYVDYLSFCDTVRLRVEDRTRSSVPMGILVTGRTKSRDTLREKLQRTPTMQLPSIDDVVGVRVVGDFTLREQDRLATSLGQAFGGAIRVRDRRADPVAGYRALHVIVRCDGLRAEIQIRTRLQAEWADLFERLADTWGRQIRYGQPPDPDSAGTTDARLRHIQAIQILSTEYIADYEGALTQNESDGNPVTEVLRRVRNPSRADLLAAMRAREAHKRYVQASEAPDEALESYRLSLVAALEELARESEGIP